MAARPILRRQSRLIAVTALVVIGHLIIARAFDMRGPGDGLMRDDAIDVSLIEWAASTPTAPATRLVAPSPPSEPRPSEAVPTPEQAEVPPPPPPPPEAMADNTLEPPPAQSPAAPRSNAPPGPTIAQRVAALMAKQARMPGGQACQFAQVLQVVLQEDSSVHAALDLMPRKSRSVANAVMLWNGQWVDPTGLGGSPAIEPIRAAFVDGVSGAPRSCQTRIMRGPLFIPISQRDETIMLAVGSGEWRWADMLEPGTDTGTAPPSLLSRLGTLLDRK